MKFKLNPLLAATMVALAAGSAQAQLSSPGGGTRASDAANGSLIFAALDKVGSPISFTANLDYSLLGFLPSSAINAPGQTIVWNFGANTVSVDGVSRAASSGSYQYASVFSTFANTAQSSELTWGVFAADNNSNPVGNANNLARRNIATTGAPTADDLVASTSSITNQKITGATANIASITTILNNGSTPPNTIQNGVGAQSATTGTSYLGDTGGTAIRTDYGGQFTFDFMVADKAASKFTLFTGSGSGTQPSAVTEYSALDIGTGLPQASTFQFDLAAGTLTWQTAALAAPVPEPSSFAMLAAGLAAIGAMVRRRRRSV